MKRKHLLTITQEKGDTKVEFLEEIDKFVESGYTFIDANCIDKNNKLSEARLSKNMCFLKVDGIMNDCCCGDN